MICTVNEYIFTFSVSIKIVTENLIKFHVITKLVKPSAILYKISRQTTDHSDQNQDAPDFLSRASSSSLGSLLKTSLNEKERRK